MTSTVVSLIICTRNRADHLRETLEAMGAIHVPPHLSTELLVVDNGSTDNTAEIVRSCTLPNMPVVYEFAPQRGKAHAHNTGMEAAKGDIFLWTDDDVRPPQDWIAAMCEPIISGKADAVAGKVKMAPHLERPWMTRTHYDRLSDTRFMPEDFGSMIGANMAFHRRVREKVPVFDTELGPGALGFMDDSLYAFQIVKAGYRLVAAPSVVVDHHFEESRLLRGAWLQHGEATARSEAYVRCHWLQEPVPLPYLQWAVWQGALWGYRMIFRPSPADAEGCDRREIRLVQNAAYFRHYLKERKRPLQYAPRGLEKQGAAEAAPSQTRQRTLIR